NTLITQSFVVSAPSSGLSITVSLALNDTGGIAGQVTKTGQTTPPVGAEVIAEKVGEPDSGKIFSAKVDTNGNYGMNKLPPGRYKVRASFSGANGPESFAVTGSTDVIAGSVAKRNITFP
ncbi:MAG: carboxypeptidase-like regulatory domain-containing protein, partial [bacterium]